MVKIIEVKTEDIIPYENNPRRNDQAVEKVAESIKQFGFKVPIVIDKENVIVSGHTRLKAAELLGLDKIPCIVADDLTEAQIKMFRLADNKTAELAEWDFEKLEEELAELTEKFNIVDFGFEELHDIEWDDVGDISEENYDKPEKDMLECPHCHHVDSAIHFKKVSGEDLSE